MWNDDKIQFARLLAEIKAVGLTPSQVTDLLTSMDITRDQLTELFDRAEEVFEDAKPPP